MGMFDTIKVDSSLLPVEDDEKTFLQGKDFQTKSFNNFMDDYEITGGGELLMYYYKLVNYDTEIKDDDWTGMFGRAKRVLDRKSKVDYHGVINFYYYDNNVSGSVVLFEAMAAANIKTIVFSSSATVYGDPHTVPIKEDFPLSTTNPYGASKLMIENILRDVKVADASWRIALLRYFNPVGAHSSGLIGEDPNGIPNNLMPYIAQVAVGKRSHLQVFGGDYPTHDGTGVRDYIHVIDLAKGHVKALQYLEQNQELITVNLGTGKGYSVLDMLKAMEKASGKAIAYQIVERRAGDIASCYADPEYAFSKIGWQAEFDQERMCIDMWRWQSQNPNGYN